MKAAVLRQFNSPFEIEDIEVDDPRSGEVLVRMVGSGVCHTDLSLRKGYFGGVLPMIPGHEGAGVIDKVGDNVSKVKKGEPVLLTWMPSCGECFYCSSGKPNLCERVFAVPSGTLMDGTRRFHKGDDYINHGSLISTFAEYSVVPESCALTVSEEIPLDKACLMGCAVLTGVGAVLNTAGVKEGSTVGVIGLGGVGLNVVQGSVIAAADRIIGIDSLPWKLMEARRFGATDSVDPGAEDVVERVREMTDGRGVDYAFEVVGTPATIRLAFDITRPGGTVVLVGIGRKEDEFSIGINAIHEGEKTIKGCHYGSVNPRVDMARYLRFYREGKLKLDELVSKKFSLEQINEAFNELEMGKLNRGVIAY